MDSDNVNRLAELGQPSAAPPENITNARPSLGSRSRWMAPVFLIVYGALVVAAAVPLIIFDIVKATPDESFKRILSGVAFIAMVIAIPISLWGIINHIVCFTRPSLQKYVVRILWVIPIYELNSWFSLRFPVTEVYLDALRQVYQSYVVYNFANYILAFLEDTPNQSLIVKCKRGALNYTVIQTIAAIAIVITYLTGTYGRGSFSPKTAYLWLTIIVTVSKIVALSALTLLRRASRDELQMLPRSAYQFAGIHLVIFITGFQGTIIDILAQAGVFKPMDAWGFEDNAAFARTIQGFLICLELVGCALLFFYSFDYKRYDTEDGDRMSIPQALKQMWTLPDIISNVRKRIQGSEDHTSDDQQILGWQQ